MARRPGAAPFALPSPPRASASSAQRALVERAAQVGGGHRAARPARQRRPGLPLGFPVFDAPYEVPFIAVTEKAFTHSERELRRAAAGLAAHERLERIVLSERGLDGVAAALAS